MFSLIFILPLCLAHLSAYQEPEEAFSELWLNHTVPGEVDQLGDLTVFRYGPSTNDKWVIWGHDIYGVDSGRTKEYCEKMNTDLGVTCILPDFFRGAEGKPDPIPVWDGQLSLDWEERLVPYLEAGGAQSVGVVGTCFGSYIAIQTSASGASFMKGGVSIHPAHPGLMESASEDEAETYAMIESPQFFMDTPDSAESVRKGGLASTVIATTYFDEFEDPCNHGFFNRGDLTDPAVEECVSRAMDHLVEFMTDYVLN
eukprot:TRINITY_DN4321_c0_g1_i8.p1 TRINITY_DN4321_c0_g1~~TRINITY_DN4321_c0_g1_i8.p1  ORF type:complete len:256 (-),score=50.93 TRINITY_DN4321_c0_g1_i8:74-841(-)